jgi:hypothetical protein
LQEKLSALNIMCTENDKLVAYHFMMSSITLLFYTIKKIFIFMRCSRRNDSVSYIAASVYVVPICAMFLGSFMLKVFSFIYAK